MNPQTARERVEGARSARLATVDSGGRAHLVPICFVLEGETLYSAVDQKPKTTRRLRRLENVRRRPEASVLVDHYEEDWSRLWWVRLRGRAEVLDEGAETERASASLARKYLQYAERPPPGPVIALRIEDWRWWSAEPR